VEKQERLELSANERDRLKVLHEVEQGSSEAEAGRGTTGDERPWVSQDAEAVSGKERCGGSARSGGQAFEPVAGGRDGGAGSGGGEKGVRDFAPTLAAEYLGKDLSLELSRETLRQLMIREGIWQAKPRRISEVHTWRPR
jgi:hypothetical protein